MNSPKRRQRARSRRDPFPVPMKRRRVDGRRRIVMPVGCPAHSAVTIQQLDDATWVIRRQGVNPKVKFVAFPLIDRLADDPEWEAVEARMA